MKNLIFLLVIVIMTANGCKNFKNSSEDTIDTLFADTATSEVEPVDSAALFEAMENYRISSQPAAQEESPAVPNPVTASESGNKYFMIVGCFTIPGNAEQYASQMRDLGYDASIIQGRDNFQMVSARSYSNYQESIREIEMFRNEVSPEAWVHVMR